MAYEKKIEPISRWEVFMAGFSLQLFLVLHVVLPSITMGDECEEAIFESDIESQDDMTSFHDCIAKYRSNLLTGSACILLSFPTIICHIFYSERIHETIISFLNFGLLFWLHHISWLIFACIYCTIIPALGIFLAYYDWEFSDDYLYIGYTMQYQLFHLFLILCDCLLIPLAFAATIPWIGNICILYNLFPSKIYTLSEQGRINLVGSRLFNMKCGKCLVTLVLLFVIIVTLFGAFADVFDFNKDGFFSYKGGSQFFGLIIIITFEASSLLYMAFSCKLDNHIQFLNDNVESMANQDNIQMGSYNQETIDTNNNNNNNNNDGNDNVDAGNNNINDDDMQIR